MSRSYNEREFVLRPKVKESTVEESSTAAKEESGAAASDASKQAKLVKPAKKTKKTKKTKKAKPAKKAEVFFHEEEQYADSVSTCPVSRLRSEVRLDFVVMRKAVLLEQAALLPIEMAPKFLNRLGSLLSKEWVS